MMVDDIGLKQLIVYSEFLKENNLPELEYVSRLIVDLINIKAYISTDINNEFNIIVKRKHKRIILVNL